MADFFDTPPTSSSPRTPKTPSVTSSKDMSPNLKEVYSANMSKPPRFSKLRGLIRRKKKGEII